MEKITESFSTDVTIVEEDKDDNILGRARFQISEIDKRNRNGRVYPRSVWEAQVRRFVKGSVTGQDGHPGFLETPRITDAFLVFDKIEIEGDRVFAEAVVANTDDGKKFVTIAKAGAKIADSTRGMGTIETVDKWSDGKRASIVQDDFKLLGVDVMFDNYQSVPGAKMKTFMPEAIHFVHEDWRHMNENITPEVVQEDYPEVYDQIVQPLQKQINDLTEKVEDANSTNETLQTQHAEEKEQVAEQLRAAEVTADSLRDELAEQTAATETATGQVETLNEQLQTITEGRDTAQARIDMMEYIHERILGEPAAMLMLRQLAQFETKDEVKESFARIKKEAEAALAGYMPQGRSLHVENEQDQNIPPTTDVDPEVRRYANLTGLTPVG